MRIFCTLRVHCNNPNLFIFRHDFEKIRTVENGCIPETQRFCDPNAERTRIFGKTLGKTSALGNYPDGTVQAGNRTPDGYVQGRAIGSHTIGTYDLQAVRF